jgi:tRNA G18 (ribose-2'-O)-methylase SpoU
MICLTSSQNPMVKRLSLLLRDGRYRAAEGVLVLEGEKAVFDAISRGHRCLNLVLSDAYASRGSVDFSRGSAAGENGIQRAKPFVSELYFSHSVQPNVKNTIQLARDIFEKVSLMKHATGVMGVFAIPQWDRSLWQKATGQVAVLDAIQSPQNVGAIIRNAAAFGVEALLLLPGSADPTHPEVLRASSGYALDVPIFRCHPNDVTVSRFTVLMLSASGQLCVGKDPLPKPCLWVLGNEGRGPTWGVSHSVSARIAMMATVESLNVAVASGICFHAGMAT